MTTPASATACRAAYEVVMRDLLRRAAARLANDQACRDAAGERAEQTNEQEMVVPDQARTPGLPGVASRRTKSEDEGVR